MNASEAIEICNKARAKGKTPDLSRAELSEAYLAGAYLAGAYLAYAYLAYADLSRANLSRANLTGADLMGADLTGADLADANLSRANLAGVNLMRANLTGAVMPDPGFERIPSKAMAELIILRAEDGLLDMSAWHTCETTHCAWGWATTLNGVGGKVLERLLGIQAAGAILFPEFAPFVMASNEQAMAELKRIAGTEDEGVKGEG